MYKLSTKNYAEVLLECWEAKTPLMVKGGPGIGKSEIPQQVFKKIAKDMGREFFTWDSLDYDRKREAIETPEKFFIFSDQRIAQMDVTDLRGIPVKMEDGILETLPPSWVIQATKPNAAGIIFFDEINLAAPVVAGAAYQIIHDRSIADRKLAEDVYLIAAGNRATDRAAVNELPFPLRDRFCEAEVYPTLEDWTAWAHGNVNPHIIAFIQFKQMYLYRGDNMTAGEDKVSTPRGLVRASRLIGDSDLNSLAVVGADETIDSSRIHRMMSIAVGEACATEFVAYVKHYQALKWELIYAKPEIVKNFETDKMFAISGGMSEQLREKPETELFEKQLSVMEYMPDEFAIVALRMLRDTLEATNRKAWERLISKSPKFDTLASKFMKFLVG